MGFSKFEVNDYKKRIEENLARPELNAWQRKFLTDMQARFNRYGTKTKLSDKQAAKLREIVGAGDEPAKYGEVEKPKTATNVSSGKPQRRTASRPANRYRRRTWWDRRRLTTKMKLIAIGGAAVFAALGGIGDLLDGSGPVGRVYTPEVSSVAPSTGRIHLDVVDGDTVRTSTGASVRLVGFNTPETYKPQCDRELVLGKQATARLKSLLSSAHSVDLQLVACACKPGTQGTDACNFGRNCGVLKVDGTDVGQTLIAEGLAARFVCGATSCPRLPRPWCRG